MPFSPSSNTRARTTAGAVLVLVFSAFLVLAAFLVGTEVGLLFALVGARRQLEGVFVLLGTHGAIHEFAGTFDQRTEWIVAPLLGIGEPTTQAGVADSSALATVRVLAAVHRALEFVDHVEETTKQTGGQVVAHALENVQDLVVVDLVVFVFVDLLVESLQSWQSSSFSTRLWSAFTAVLAARNGREAHAGFRAFVVVRRR